MKFIATFRIAVRVCIVVLIVFIAHEYYKLYSLSTFHFTRAVPTVETVATTIAQEVTNPPLLFVGDIMLGRYVERLVVQHGDSYLLADVEDLLRSHTVIANLEGPIPEVHRPTPSNGFTFSFPKTTPQFLKDNHIAAVSLSNNHGLDQKMAGHEHTKKVLDDVGVVHFGANYTTTEDYFETQVGTTSIVIIGMNMISDSWNERRALEVAKRTSESHPDSILVVYIHWGNEYDHLQGSVQRIFARKLIESGVDVIIGSHPHVTQGIELYKGRPIFYSLGNFIFDQYFSEDVQESIGVGVQKFGEDMVFALLPFQSIRSQVSVATGTKAEAIMHVVKKNSSEEVKKMLSGNELRMPISVILNNK
jgi:poly-gamma-glutamate synthesis protein (capsule biosynthesis protein)